MSHNCLSSSSDLPNQEVEGTGHTGHFPTSQERRLLSGGTGWHPPDVRPMLQVCCGILPIKVLSELIRMPPAGFNFSNGTRGGLKEGPGNGAEINVKGGLVESSGFSESTHRACHRHLFFTQSWLAGGTVSRYQEVCGSRFAGQIWALETPCLLSCWLHFLVRCSTLVDW